LNISWDFDVQNKVIKKRGMFTVGDQWVVHICLMLITSKPRFEKPPEMSSEEIKTGRCHMLLGFGIEGEVWEVIAVKVRADG
jgi:hypothetical protein